MPIFPETLYRGHVHRTPVNLDRRPETDFRKSPSAERHRPSHGEIAELAYSYWEARGRLYGSELEDWLRAERELKLRYGT
jgi:hypothetical protein